MEPLWWCAREVGAANRWQSLRLLRARLGLSQGELKAAVLRWPQLLYSDMAPSLARVQEKYRGLGTGLDWDVLALA